jgi:hypothetical protein
VFNLNGVGLIYLAIGVVVAGAILSSPIADEAYTDTYYTYEPYIYELTFVRESQVGTSFLGLKEVTQVQYFVKNNESIDGEFVLNFNFDNGTKTDTKTIEVTILKGEKKAVTMNSPLSGKSTFTLNVTPPKKAVLHQEPKTKKITGWEALWRLMPFVK